MFVDGLTIGSRTIILQLPSILPHFVEFGQITTSHRVKTFFFYTYMKEEYSNHSNRRISLKLFYITSIFSGKKRKRSDIRKV